MKKLVLTTAIILGLSMTTFADGGGLFGRGASPEQEGGNRTTTNAPVLPQHNASGNQDGDEVPVGTGIAILATLGAAYLVGKKRREE